MRDRGDAPIASLPRLKQLGLDPRKFGSCSEPEEKRSKQQGRVTLNRGCNYEHECPWAHNLDYMLLKDGETDPRPRHLKTRTVKPRPDGGDTVRDSYCSCFQWHDGLKQRDGKNGEIVEVIGGEGDMVQLKGSEPKGPPVAGEPTVWIPKLFPTKIPRFPDPEDVPALADEVQSAKLRADSTIRKRAEGRTQRLGLTEQTEEITFGDIQEAIAERDTAS
jgi:hypothetical protein